MNKGLFGMVFLENVFSNNDEALINKKLPKELLLRIFSFLDIVTLCRCAQVSKAWNVLALDGSNWQRIDLFNFQTDIEGRVVENISKRCGGFLRQLSLRGCLGVGDSSLKYYAAAGLHSTFCFLGMLERRRGLYLHLPLGCWEPLWWQTEELCSKCSF
uniref:F-box domain-containing protein n=1 Tax=Crocodylus porosus TaxID=8502 RepID=A0A7M4ENE0_CROPO